LRILRRVLLGIGVLLALFMVAAVASRRAGDATLFPAPAGEPRVMVAVTAGTYHAGLVMPVAELAAAAARTAHGEVIGIAARFQAYPYVEIGWGDEGFYRLVPTVAALTAGEALRALFRPGNPSVLHVVGFDRLPVADVAGLRTVPIALSQRGFERLVARLAESVATENGRPVELGQGLYGPSLFYRAKGEFSLFNVCNHWVGRLLDAAGVPTTPALDTLPLGLTLDLAWRAGLAADAAAAPLDITPR
jgi:uncharacterized protein (TIGR02117 family)